MGCMSQRQEGRPNICTSPSKNTASSPPIQSTPFTAYHCTVHPRRTAVVIKSAAIDPSPIPELQSRSMAEFSPVAANYQPTSYYWANALPPISSFCTPGLYSQVTRITTPLPTAPTSERRCNNDRQPNSNFATDSRRTVTSNTSPTIPG